MFHSPKRLLALIAPLALVAALSVAPAMASASPTLLSGGVMLKKGTQIRATGGSTIKTVVPGVGILECDDVTLTGTVAENPGAFVNAGTGTTQNCHVEEHEVIITSITWKDRFNAEPNDTGHVAFVYDVPDFEITKCTLAGDVATLWSKKSSLVELVPSVLTGPAGCPASGTISGELTLETTTTPAVPVVVEE